MPGILRFFGRWHKFTVCLVWLLAILGLLSGGRFEMFLIPEFFHVLWPAAVILILFTCSRIGEPPSGGIVLREAAGALLLLLPLYGIWRAEGMVLESDAFNTRFIGGLSTGEGDGPAAGTPPGTGFSNQPVSEVPMDKIFENPYLYAGRRLAVVGMLTTDNRQVAELMGRNCPVLFRFAMTCCAADAIPLALVVDLPESASLEENAWARVTGKFAIRRIQGQKIPILEEPELRPVKRPERPYL
ncbi:MAG: TIGR03943 family protein [Planctomycetota bacterium]|jgi:uncharacterized repeat protein (TIGR03943 family)|nr:TIGR03943 family protein [Planctomycetota bacterium]